MSKDGAKWRVKTTIEKYDNAESWKAGIPDEVQEIKGNLLVNEGVNAIWALVANLGAVSKDEARGIMADVTILPFSHDNAHIGVGNHMDSPTLPDAADTDLGLTGPNYVYMGMDDGYPKYFTDKKITFKSTFKPGIACFNWYEWTIANGNNNVTDLTTGASNANGAIGDDLWRDAAKGTDLAPDPTPTAGAADPATAAYYPKDGTADDQTAAINLNHKIESMGQKYAPATWVVATEISLS